MARSKASLTEDEIIQIEALACTLNLDQIADYFGISRRTFGRIAESNPEIGARYKKGKARIIRKVANRLIDLVDKGDKAAIIFYLKTQAGWRETVDQNITQTTLSFTKEQLDELTTSELEALKKAYQKLNKKKD